MKTLFTSFIFLALSLLSYSQVIYTDVSPDEVLNTGDSYEIDFNSDGNFDIKISPYDEWGEKVAGLRLTSTSTDCQVSGWNDGTNIQLGQLSLNDPINSSDPVSFYPWTDQAHDFPFPYRTIFSTDFTGTAFWSGVTNKYLPIRIPAGGSDYFYGWVELSVNAACTEIIVHAYAYESTINTEILAGDQGAPAGLTADFSGTPTTIYEGQSVDFTDATTGGSESYTYDWTFTGGSPTSSTDENPQDITYNTAGTYDVSLTVDDGSKATDTETKTDYITVLGAPVAAFSANNTNPTATISTVTFTDASTDTPTSWSWVFSPSTVTYQNSTSSSSQNPQVTFDAAGDYTVTLTATNPAGSDDEVKTNYITVAAAPTTNNWTGNVSASWENADNWTGNVPNAGDDVVIPNGVSNNPVISSDAVCNDLTIQNSYPTLTITAGNSLTVNGTLTCGDAYQFLLQSNVSGTAQLLHANSGQSAYIEQFIAGHGGDPDAGWHLIGTFSDNYWWDFTLWNPTFGSNSSLVCDLYGWDEVNYVWSNGRDWASQLFELEKGYLVSYEANRTQQISGIVNVSDVTVPLTNTLGKGEGWNLLGNPFSCAIDIDLVTIPAGVDKSVYVYDESLQDYKAYNQTSGTGDFNGIIPIYNGFFVKSSQATSITIPASARLIGSNNFYKNQTNGFDQTLQISLNQDDYQNNAWFQLNQDASAAFDSDFDAYNMHSLGSVPEIYIESEEGEELSISASNELNAKIGIIIPESGAYQLQIDGLNSFNGMETLYLNDYKNQVQYQITENFKLDFEAQTDDTQTRFELTTVQSATGIQEIYQDFVFSNNQIRLINHQDEYDIQVFDLGGRLIWEDHHDFRSNPVYSLNLTGSIYILKLTNSQNSLTQKVLPKI